MTDVEEVRRSLANLAGNLHALIAVDPEQEVQGIAVPVVEHALEAAKSVLAGNPVADAVSEVITVRAIEEEQVVRAADMLIVVDQLLAALPPPPRAGPRTLRFR